MEMSNDPKTQYHYSGQLKCRKANKEKKKPIKVTYISSPMMVKANNASEFRAIVQELTGQNSDVTSPCSSAGTVVTEETSSTVIDYHGSSGARLGLIENNHHDVCMNIALAPLLKLEEDFLWREFVDSFQFPPVLV